MYLRIFPAILVVMLLTISQSNAIKPGTKVYYYLTSSSEHQSPPVRRVRLVTGPIERHGSTSYQWWEMHLEKPDGNVLGLRVLSKNLPLISNKPVGEIKRYIYSPAPGECLEYVDYLTGNALLPELRTFVQDYFPTSAPDARYIDGFSTTGKLLGHTLVRTLSKFDFPRPSFDNPTVLRLRSDLIIGSQADVRDDRDENITADLRENTPYTRDEYMELIAAGANYFHPTPEAVNWIKNLPVFWSARGSHPDDFYRSNFVPGQMFIDEPATRFGWDKGITTEFLGPEIIANAIRMRIEEAELYKHRIFDCENFFHTGTMEALYNNYPSWETQYYTAWYQLQGGAPGFVFEGRYVKRGYGWNPEALLGSGLEDLDDKQQFDYFHAFLRGAARRWGGYWGTSVYPEGDKSMMIPALKRAYDQGARCLWFWNDRDLPYKFRLEVLKALNEHVKCHPSRNCDKASTAIVLPSGYMLTEDGIWGVRREQINSFGINYGDIAATALFEGILLSREGIEFDYVNDHPEIGKAGYKQLIYIRENGQTQWVPKKNHKNKPINLSLSVKRVENTYTPPDKAPQYEVRRASNISVDGNLDDWTKARWIEMNGQPYHFGDNYELDLTLTVPSDVNEKSDQKCLGFTWDQINEEYRQRYLLEGYGSDQVVVTSIISGGAAERAGLREGDIILRFGEKRIRWAFEVWGMVDWCKRRPSTNIDIRIQRNGTDRLEGSTDLSARFAFLVDDDNLYIALDVTDDVHYQMMHGADLWMNDSVQIGIDPTNARTTGYGENGHEFGLALCNGKDVVWRWSGRRGQPENAIKTAQTKIVRRGYHTIYEAKVPLHELTPLAPDMWHQAGICVVVNDSDGTPYRKARLELSPGAMTRGKNLAMFPLFEFEPSLNHKKVSAALFWLKRCMKPEGAAQLLICTSSPATEKAIIKCKLSSLDDPDSRPLTAKTYIDLTSEVSSYLLSVHTSSNPGRYKLAVEITDPTGRVSANDSLPIYIYK